ncbi:helix-turn-helix domain-containing protein [Shewanella psychropiezotolerans]|uniref:Helix-turn-helix domain-containing protein n=1 Tax=Shewanella psychropiezotolerans TaxID=2593655 RepID=A0ABX5WZM0_9GAMM|nr:S24 family peptidase [Shewanella psychropiezotolerans]QDO82446.1 helix-turn-helix domain-containing protein [Shewanella psychropiezotolerans]
MREIGTRIKRQRNLIGKTQKELAMTLEITSVAVSRWELGDNQPKGELLEKLANALKVSAEWILTGVDPDGELAKLKQAFCWIPYYKHIEVSSGNGFVCVDETLTHIPIPSALGGGQLNKDGLFCLHASGTSMEPVLKTGSIVVVDSTQQHIRDGMMFVIRQGQHLRIKLLSETPSSITFKSYNSEYPDEVYSCNELHDFEVIGQVIWFSTPISC